ncbi:Uncharacterised protein g1539 [Pycnogonum litorale]
MTTVTSIICLLSLVLIVDAKLYKGTYFTHCEADEDCQVDECCALSVASGNIVCRKHQEVGTICKIHETLINRTSIVDDITMNHTNVHDGYCPCKANTTCVAPPPQVLDIQKCK